MNEFFSSMLISDWLNFIGTIIGALIGGLIAYLIANRQIKRMKNDAKVEEIKKFFKIYHVLSPLLDRILNLLINSTGEKRDKKLPSHTLDYYMVNYLYSLDDNYIEIANEYLKQIINIRNEMESIYDTINNLNDDYILYDFYGTYHNILLTLKRIINFIDKFLYHDDNIPKDEFQKKLNMYYEGNGRNKIVQHKMAIGDESKEYIVLFENIDADKNYLIELFEEKKKEKNKLEK